MSTMEEKRKERDLLDHNVYYAHTVDGQPEEKWQTMRSHAENVAELVKTFSAPWCTAEYAENLGLLHDVGKYQQGFQRRLRGDPTPMEHAVCGARQWLSMGWPESGAYCIAGHHSGLPDVGSRTDSPDESTLLGRLKRQTQDFSAFRRELTLRDLRAFPAKDAVCTREKDAKKEYAFWTRMMFSCLTDADFLDTEAACGGPPGRGVSADFEVCRRQLEEALSRFQGDTPVKRARDAMRRQVMSHAGEEADVCLINMPTGSGKTLASMQFALERAVRAGKKHIIYVIPFTSIIEQNAKIFKDIFGADAVLEHHCNFDYDAVGDPAARERLRRTAENWDASIVVTTNVQFFQSIYGNRSSQLRKLHNMADSVIVFDEAHMFPSLFFQPCLEAVRILTARYGCQAVFMTATMPDFRAWMEKFGCGGVKTAELVEDKRDFPVFRRCAVEYLGALPLEKLTGLAQQGENALIVVNSRRAARRIYELLPGKNYHLSTYMTHEDRSATIEEVRRALREHRRFCLVSTSLIEAGVDLDFDLVFRELAGLDNLLQTAGRCNREGNKAGCRTCAFEFQETELQPRSKDFRMRQSFCREVFEKFSDAASPEAVSYYFDHLYAYTLQDRTSMDFQTAVSPSSWGREGVGFDFRSYADAFRLIDEDTRPLVIVTDENRAVVKPLLEALARGGMSVMRRLQKYSLSLRRREFDQLLQAGAVCSAGGVSYLGSPQFYRHETGICFENNGVCVW